MPRLLLAFAVALTAFVGGCGGADIAYTEVESAPVGLPIPENVGTVSDSVAAGDDTDNGNVTTGKSTPTPAPATAIDDGVVAAPTAEVPTAAPVTPPVVPVTPEDTTDDDTGAAAPPTVEETVPPSDTGGAVAPGNDQFCADNPGACND